MAATSAAKKASPAPMPIGDYDQLSIKQVLPLLKTLSSRDLKAVTAYEKAGKNRVTLLRGIRKIELAREAAASRKAPKARLEIVGDEPEAPAAETVVPVAAMPVEVEATVEPAPVERETVRLAPVKPAPVRKTRTRTALKAATWEQEIEPQLPSHFKTSAAAFEFDYDFDAPATPGPPSDDDMVAPVIPVPRAHPTAHGPAHVRAAKPERAPRSRPAEMVKRFENVALVMAAILAVLLGLAIGTVLARTGGTDPTPPTSASQAAVVQTAG